MEFSALSVILWLTVLIHSGQTQDKPVVTIIEPENKEIFLRDIVTLKCEIPGGQGRQWTYSWYKNGKVLNYEQNREYRFSVTENDNAEYTCTGTTRASNPVTIPLSAVPRATLRVDPDNRMFTGESVTLQCDIESDSNWRYQWYKGNNNTKVYQSQTNTLTISSAADQDQYWCRGERHYRPSSSHLSNSVTLTVKAEKPKPELTSSHKGAALIGSPVVLDCKLDQSAGWKFYWYKHTQNPENETKTETHSYTISSVSVSDGGQYWCRAGRGNPVYYTHYSDAVWIQLTSTTPSVSLMVSPRRTQHFYSNPLILSCEGQSDSSRWRVRRYTRSDVSDCKSDRRPVTGSTCSISSLHTSYTGVYWCESESGESSNPVNITVHYGAVILESPVHPVTEGDPLTLRCLHHHYQLSDFTAEFYKDGSLLQTQTTGEMTIHTVSKSDEGLYHCKHPERGESPQSWISVRGVSTSGASFSACTLLSSLMAVSPYLLVSIILAVKCYRARVKPDEDDRI